MLQLGGRRGAAPRFVLEHAGRHDHEMDMEIADAIRNLTIEDMTAAAPGTARASHRVAEIHPPHWRRGN